MSLTRFYYLNENKSSAEEISTIAPYDDDDKDDDFEYLPYSSSSVDRSSIGSIPWADDAIRQNQLDWERVENMLNGSEALPDEPELRNEIEEWLRKFPPTGQEQRRSFETNANDSLELGSILNLSLDSQDDDDENDKFDGLATPTQEPSRTVHDSLANPQRQPSAYKFQNVPFGMEEALRINSVPLTLQQRRPLPKGVTMRLPRPNAAHDEDQSDSSATIIITTPSPPVTRISPKLLVNSELTANATNSAHATQRYHRLRMPPILSVLESKRQFRGLASNHSFVQLTQVQQAKSAAIANQHERKSYSGLKTSWRAPIAAAALSSRFFNNRNSIVLPALNLQRIRETGNTSTTISDDNLPKVSHSKFLANNILNSSGTSSSTLRSISAALHQPRMEHSFYTPYSASKFKAFK